jgi:hypothetical protein
VSRPKRSLIPTPSEWRVVRPIKEIADFIRERLGKRVEEVSDYRIAKFFSIIEDYVNERTMKSTALAEIVKIIDREFGLSSDEEKERMNASVIDLLDELHRRKKEEPIRTYRLVRDLRTLLIQLVRGNLTVEFVPPSSEAMRKG